MDIVKALKQEEAKLEKQAKRAAKHLAAVRDAIKAFGGSLTVGAKALIGKKKRKLSAAGRAKISKAAKLRWAKVRAAKAKGVKTAKAA
jgi:hypothetical protein